MKTTVFALVGASILAFAAADCPNACSGQGICSTNNDFCQCYEGFTGADCSMRVCPFAQAFIDLPQGDLNHDNSLSGGGSSTTATSPNGVASGTSLNPDFRTQGWWERHPSQLYGTGDQVSALTWAVRADEGHFYAECSGVGICDRSSGECSCFPGYGGVACNRTVCPSDCSGHGICRTLADTLPADIEWYQLWEATKSTRCVCDAGFDGLDCSERVCPNGNDPLTTTTTRAEYNNGLTETGEVQNVDVRCKYGGTAINPIVALTYTDPDSMMSYETSNIDLSTATSADIATALKALPNDILADYSVDGTTINARLVSAVKTEFESSKFWRIALTFDSSMGDIPMVGVRADSTFICKNALNVETGFGLFETMENVVPEAIGDGPSKKLIFDVAISTHPTHGYADNLTYSVYGDNFATLTEGVAPQSVSMSGFTAGTAAALTNAALFDREAALVKLDFEGGDGAATGNSDVRSSSVYGLSGVVRYHLTYDPFPALSVSNPTASLVSTDDYWRDTKQVYLSPNGTREVIPLGAPLYFHKPADSTPAYDMRIVIRNSFLEINAFVDNIVNKTVAHSRAELLINDEHIAFINGSFPDTINGVAIGSTIPTGFDYRLPTEFVTAVPVVTFDNITNATGHYISQNATIFANSSFVVFTPKTPIVIKNTGVDTIDVAFADDEAFNQSLVLVIKIVSTSSNPDTYAWKFAGDSSFMDNGGAGYPIPANVSVFYNLHDDDVYLNTASDDDRRWQASRVQLRWTNGADFDQRVACTSGTTNFYYIQIGSNGLNDRPVCADRGMCDSSSGECSCFAGYTGPDCSEQNALARGGSSA